MLNFFKGVCKSRVRAKLMRSPNRTGSKRALLIVNTDSRWANSSKKGNHIEH